MREEIRLGNEALARNDLDDAGRNFQKLLDTGGTDLQERIAVNRLRDIQDQRARLAAEQAPPVKPRARRKTATSPKSAPEPAHEFIRPPDEPVVVIKRY